MSHQDAAFDKVMYLVGNKGRFHNRFNIIYNGVMVFFGAMLARSFLISMNIPDHWCHVPGRELTNYTLDEWKNITLPRERNTKGHDAFSKCKMFNVTNETLHSWEKSSENLINSQETLIAFHKNLEVIECDKYDYDKRWYENTIGSQENWVCSKDLAQTNTYAFNHIGDILGLFIFGRLGDRYGRRIVFYIGIATTVTGRLLTAFSASNLFLFRASAILAAFGDTPLYFAPYTIAMEISRPEDRSRVAIIQCIGWNLGMALLPFAFWVIREWFYFYLMCSLPLLFFYLIPSFMIESPRWLITRGNYKQAAHHLNHIARVNRKPIVITETMLRSMVPNVDEKVREYGMLSLFSGTRLATNSTVLVITWMICSMSFSTTTLYVEQSAGNPFINYFIQSLSELPAYFIGMILIDRVGRRWTNTTSSLGAAILIIPAIIFCTSQNYGFLTNWAVAGVKFFTAITFFVVGLQGSEMYPTCLRQTGFALCAIGANISGTISPYIAYMGKKWNAEYPLLALFILFIIGCFAGLYLPETLHHKLPDTLEDARSFGKGQKIWSLPKPPPIESEENDKDDEFEALNRTSI